MFCKNCGTELNENAKFCNNCCSAVGVDDKCQHTESAPAAPAAKKHTLRNVFIALIVLVVFALIVVAILILKTPTSSSDLTNSTSSSNSVGSSNSISSSSSSSSSSSVSSSNSTSSTSSSSLYASEPYDSSISLPYEEEIVVGTWYLGAIHSVEDDDTAYYSRDSATLNLYSDHTGNLYTGETLSYSFTWSYKECKEGFYFYSISESNGNIIGGIYDSKSEFFFLGTGETVMGFEK